MAQDPLSEVVRALDLKGGLFLEARMTAPWAFIAQVGPEDCRPFMDVPAQVIAYHAVTHGRMLVAADGVAPPEVRAGDIILLPRNDPHMVMSGPGVAPSRGEDLLVSAGAGRARSHRARRRRRGDARALRLSRLATARRIRSSRRCHGC